MSDDQLTPEEVEAIADAAESEIEALRAEVAGLKEQVLRFAADAENTRRRAEREANDARAYAIQKFARDLLGVADNLSRALTASPADGGDNAVKNFVIGVEMTEKELQQAFERNGLKRIEPAKAAKFDPHQHQAMMEQPSTEVPGGTIIQVLQPGYELLGRLVRPAMVVVAARNPGEASSGEPTAAANPYGHEDGEGSGASVDTKA